MDTTGREIKVVPTDGRQLFFGSPFRLQRQAMEIADIWITTKWVVLRPYEGATHVSNGTLFKSADYAAFMVPDVGGINTWLEVYMCCADTSFPRILMMYDERGEPMDVRPVSVYELAVEKLRKANLELPIRSEEYFNMLQLADSNSGRDLHASMYGD